MKRAFVFGNLLVYKVARWQGNKDCDEVILQCCNRVRFKGRLVSRSPCVKVSLCQGLLVSMIKGPSQVNLVLVEILSQGLKISKFPCDLHSFTVDLVSFYLYSK